MSWYVASTVNNIPDDHFIYVNYINSLEIPYTTISQYQFLDYILVGGGGAGAPGTDGSGEPNYGGGGGGSGNLLSTFQFPGSTGQSATQGVFTYNIPICGGGTQINFSNYSDIDKLQITIGTGGGVTGGSGGNIRGQNGNPSSISILDINNNPLVTVSITYGANGNGGYSAGDTGFNEQGGDGYNGGGGGVGGDNNGPGGNGNIGCQGSNGFPGTNTTQAGDGGGTGGGDGGFAGSGTSNNGGGGGAAGTCVTINDINRGNRTGGDGASNTTLASYPNGYDYTGAGGGGGTYRGGNEYPGGAGASGYAILWFHN